MTIKEILDYAIKEFNKYSIEEPILKARIIIAFSIGEPKEYLISHDNDAISEEQTNECYKNIQRILQKEPIQYILGYQEFMKLMFKVNSNVLIPRADTEILVQEVINIATDHSLKILDLCTGSGAIGISLAKYLSKCQVKASDISSQALMIAQTNNEFNKTNVEFINSDLFENINEQFDIIVSNPPYIEKDTIKALSDEVKNEPILALDGGLDGLDIYRKIIINADLYLVKNGFLCLEIGYNQKEAVIELIRSSGKYDEIYSKKDLNGNDRIIICRRK